MPGWRFVKAVLSAPRELRFEEFDVGPPGAREIVAATLLSAVSSGTESAAFEGQPALRDGVTYPRLVGYCNVARVLAVGRDVVGVAPDDVIVTNESHRSGFLAPVESVLVVLRKNEDLEFAAMTYVAEIGLAALQKARLAPTEYVVVFGLGLIGLCTVAVASHLGAPVAAVGIGPSRLELARTMGAASAITADNPEIDDSVRRATDDLGPDVIVTTANGWREWEAVLRLARRNTRIAVLGFPGRVEGPPAFNPLHSRYLYAKQVEIIGAGSTSESDAPIHDVRFTLKRNMRYLLRCSKGTPELPLSRLITDRVSWTALATVYEKRLQGDQRMLGVILQWPGKAL
jgi:NADPH:quinone reductase-like Zn-dependent oxidoreductase